MDARPRRAGPVRPDRDAAATATAESIAGPQRVGIRTLTLDQSPDPDERGTRFFRFVLNGVPIFAKGADWIPCDSFVGAIPPERYTRLLGAGARRQHDDAARLGRRHLRARPLLRRVRPPRHPGLAGLHVRLRDVPGGRPGLRRRGRGRGALPGAPAAQPPEPRALVRQQREPVDPRDALLGPTGAAAVRRALLRPDPARGRRRARRRGRRTGPAARTAATTTTAWTTATATTGTSGTASSRAISARSRAASSPRSRLLPALRRGPGPLHQRVRDARRAGRRDAAPRDPARTSAITTARRWTGTTRTTRRTRATC